MSQKSRVAFGPGAASLILIVVILSMSVLGILSLMSAHNDKAFSERSIEVIQAVYTLNNQAERTYGKIDRILRDAANGAADETDFYVQIDRLLPSEISREENRLFWEESDGIRYLDCAVEIAPLGSVPRMNWVSHQLGAEIDGGL